MSMDWIHFFAEISNIVNAGVDGGNDLPAILLGIVVAYLTILISVAIAIFGEKKEFEHLDRNVILDHIVKAKALLFYLGLAFLPLLFWNSSLPWTRLFEIIIWTIGVGLITMVLFRSYHWMKGNKFPLRLCYLRDLRNRQDMGEAWRSVWETEKINSQNEHEFFKAFKPTIDRALAGEKEDLIVACRLLGDFDTFIINRSDSFLLQRGDVLIHALKWHVKIWIKDHEYIEKEDKLDEWSMYSELFRITDSIFGNIEARALSGRLPFSFFKALHSHIENNKSVVSSSQQFYVEALLHSFYQIFFSRIYNSPDRHNIWNHYFPQEWKVSKSYLQNNENILLNVALNSYLEWASSRIWEATEEKDFALDDVSKNLFPEVDPIVWAKLLIFIFSPYGEDRLCSVIERPWNFGFIGRVKVYSPSQEEEVRSQYHTEESNTYDLALYLFGDVFSKANLESYIQSLEQLSYPEEAAEERKRKTLIVIFTKMLKYLEEHG